MTLFDAQPWLITAAPVPAVDHRWRSPLPFDPVFLEAPDHWPTAAPVENAASALSPLGLMGETPTRPAASIYDPPEGPDDAPASPGLDLVLVIDTSPSMTAWYPAANAITACLRDLPHFHSVQVIEMRNRRPASSDDLFHPTDRQTLQAERFSPDRSKITLVLTDGVGAAWKRCLLWPDLYQWATSHTVAILHVLPHHHWSLSGIPAQPMQLRAVHAWCPNGQLETAPTEHDSTAQAGAADTQAQSVVIPVLEIRKRWLDQWTRLLLTDFLVHQQALTVTALAPPTAVVPAPARAQDDAPNASQLIAEFHTTAPEHAFSLAILLAVAPLNRFVMQLIATELAPAATTRDLSAVLTSGLLVSLEPSIGVANDYGKITFDFLPEVRQNLLAIGESSQTRRAIALLDTYLGAYAPALQGISERMRQPTMQALPAINEHTAPYLEIEHSLLTALSGETTAHRSVAATLRARLDST
ncbi:SAV_2336 N-terminal domain-related protein [Streptomyces asoensis]|uniref:SAV_2336 N-terminal domain-related protein n=1 Tax=Streptomyces asoensis TaxID=249586 RepID=UPI0033E7AB59